ncbi:hypothetical protein [Sideroxydans lithotrophicus]|uniref:Uncharacterized protein n=1 Tax=Sideroxydans lithotrophicus (strain ES-1) TaxID=580332 RepID=D5CTS7_SIDLE|nr:hypothetical protein [Sideroxydans lithotrophicus]ADE12239.1 conserved hypothetical protein [Sideroxydans lithotrophicus ES-1]
MEKYILLAALVFASTNALADRAVTGTNGNGEKKGGSEAEACAAAKEDVLSKRTYNEQVAKYMPCECKQNDKGNWSCTVDARLQKVR